MNPLETALAKKAGKAGDKKSKAKGETTAMGTYKKDKNGDYTKTKK